MISVIFPWMEYSSAVHSSFSSYKQKRQHICIQMYIDAFSFPALQCPHYLNSKVLSFRSNFVYCLIIDVVLASLFFFYRKISFKEILSNSACRRLKRLTIYWIFLYQLKCQIQFKLKIK